MKASDDVAYALYAYLVDRIKIAHLENSSEFKKGECDCIVAFYGYVRGTKLW